MIRSVAALGPIVRRRGLVLALAAACLELSGCAFNANAAPGSTSIDTAPTIVDVEWGEDLPIVSVLIDSRGPYRFLLDTAAGSTFITPECARETNLHLTDGDIRINAAGAGVPRSVQTSEIGALRLGGALFSDVPAVVVDMSGDFDGVLGFPVFADLLLTLDGPNQLLVLERGHLPPPESSPDVLALEPGDVEHASPRVRGRVGGHRALILIDSGFFGHLYLSASFPEVYDLAFEPDPDGQAAVSTEAGLRDVVVGRLDERVEIGPLAFEDVPTMLSMGPTVILGSGLLRGIVTTFDQRTHRVRFSRGPR